MEAVFYSVFLFQVYLKIAHACGENNKCIEKNSIVDIPIASLSYGVAMQKEAAISTHVDIGMRTIG